MDQFYKTKLLLNINIIVSIVQQNSNENGVTSLWMNLLSNINVIVIIVQQTFWQKATFKETEVNSSK